MKSSVSPVKGGKSVPFERVLEVALIVKDALEHLGVPSYPKTTGSRGIHVYVPDPWPKKRHHKRRLLQPPFVHALARRLAHGGYLHVATDWAPYAEDILATLCAEGLLVNRAQAYAERPAWRPPTKFERRGVALGHAVFDLLFERR